MLKGASLYRRDMHLNVWEVCAATFSNLLRHLTLILPLLCSMLTPTYNAQGSKPIRPGHAPGRVEGMRSKLLYTFSTLILPLLITQHAESFSVKADLPAVNKQDIKVDVDKDTIILGLEEQGGKSENKEEQGVR
jgi:hypothetical protein